MQNIEMANGAFGSGNVKKRSIIRQSGRITILFGWCIFIGAVSDFGPRISNAQTMYPWPYRRGNDVQVLFGNDRDGIRSQSISFADPNGGSQRFPRQLDTDPDHFKWAKEREQWPPKNTKRTAFDSEYDRFINEHFRQDYEEHHPESESEQMARDHERFRELPHYFGEWTPESALKLPPGPPKNFRKKLKRRRPTIQADVEDYQANDETMAIKSNGETNDYRWMMQLPVEQQATKFQQNPRHCKTIQKDDMLCQMCLNPKTGAKSESCSYSSQPDSTRYAYRNNYSIEEGHFDGDSVEARRVGNSNEETEEPEIHTSRPLRKRNKSRRVPGLRVKREDSCSGSANTKCGRWLKRKRVRPSRGELPFETRHENNFSPDLLPAKQHVKEEHYELVFKTSDTLEKNVEGALADVRTKDCSTFIETYKFSGNEASDEPRGRYEECMFAFKPVVRVPEGSLLASGVDCDSNNTDKNSDQRSELAKEIPVEEHLSEEVVMDKKINRKLVIKKRKLTTKTL